MPLIHWSVGRSAHLRYRAPPPWWGIVEGGKEPVHSAAYLLLMASGSAISWRYPQYFYPDLLEWVGQGRQVWDFTVPPPCQKWLPILLCCLGHFSCLYQTVAMSRTRRASSQFHNSIFLSVVAGGTAVLFKHLRHLDWVLLRWGVEKRAILKEGLPLPFLCSRIWCEGAGLHYYQACWSDSGCWTTASAMVPVFPPFFSPSLLIPIHFRCVDLSGKFMLSRGSFVELQLSDLL